MSALVMIARAGVAFVTTAAAVAALAASTTSCGSQQAQGSDAKNFFVSKVYPSLSPTCAECHASGKHGAPIFLADNPDGSYKAVTSSVGFIAPPTQSPLVQHGLHSGPALTDDQTRLVSTWLTMEVGNKGDDTKPTNLRAAFAAFGQCMDYGEWKMYGLDQIPQTVTSNGQCISCHNQGTAGVWLSEDPEKTFTTMSTFPYVQRLVQGTVNDQGQFDKLVDARRLIDKGNDRRQLNANHHPAFNLGEGINGVQPSVMQDNLSKFVSDTLDKIERVNGCAGTTKPDGGADSGK